MAAIDADPTEWLTPEEMRLWRGFIEASVRLFATLDAELRAAADITFDDYEVLVHLSESDGQRLRMAELSDLLIHSRSRLTQRIDRLEKRGLVSREKCDVDRRGTWAVLNEEGRALIEGLAPAHLRAVRSNLFAHIDPAEQPVLVDVYERLVTHLRGLCVQEQTTS